MGMFDKFISWYSPLSAVLKIASNESKKAAEEAANYSVEFSIQRFYTSWITVDTQSSQSAAIEVAKFISSQTPSAQYRVLKKESGFASGVIWHSGQSDLV